RVTAQIRVTQLLDLSAQFRGEYGRCGDQTGRRQPGQLFDDGTQVIRHLIALQRTQLLRTAGSVPAPPAQGTPVVVQNRVDVSYSTALVVTQPCSPVAGRDPRRPHGDTTRTERQVMSHRRRDRYRTSEDQRGRDRSAQRRSGHPTPHPARPTPR